MYYADLTDRLGALRRAPVNLTRGYQFCSFCVTEYRKRPDADPTGTALIAELAGTGGMGNGEILVVGTNSTCYYAPVMIEHYIQVHGYLPPTEFVEAVRG